MQIKLATEVILPNPKQFFKEGILNQQVSALGEFNTSEKLLDREIYILYDNLMNDRSINILRSREGKLIIIKDCPIDKVKNILLKYLIKHSDDSTFDSIVEVCYFSLYFWPFYNLKDNSLEHILNFVLFHLLGMSRNLINKGQTLYREIDCEKILDKLNEKIQFTRFYIGE